MSLRKLEVYLTVLSDIRSDCVYVKAELTHFTDGEYRIEYMDTNFDGYGVVLWL